MRTLQEIQDTATRLNDGKRVKVWLNPRLKRWDGVFNPLTGAVALYSGYQDDQKASDKHVEAVLLHELGHAHDPIYRGVGWAGVGLVIFWLLAFAVMVAGLLTKIDFYLLFISALVLYGALSYRLDRRREERADAWARARMPDFDAYKHLPNEKDEK